MSAQKIAAREVQLGYAPSALSAVSRSGADEIGATAAEPTTQMDDGDGLDHVFPLSMAGRQSVGECSRSASARRLIEATSLPRTRLSAVLPMMVAPVLVKLILVNVGTVQLFHDRETPLSPTLL
jgi:hypothetical protein